MNKIENFVNLLKSTRDFREVHAAEILCYEILPDPAYDNDVKLKCIDKLAEKIATKNKESCTVGLLKQFARTFSDHLEHKSGNSENVISYLRQVFGHPAVIQSFSDACKGCKKNFFFSVSAGKISQLFTNEVALQVLRSNLRRKIFVLFGFHPVIREHVDLQVKWIKICARYSSVRTYFGLHNITNEALQSVPIDIAYKFLELPFLTRDYKELKDKLRHLNLQTIESIVLTYIIAHGKNATTEHIINQIKKIKEMYEHSDQQ